MWRILCYFRVRGGWWRKWRRREKKIFLPTSLPSPLDSVSLQRTRKKVHWLSFFPFFFFPFPSHHRRCRQNPWLSPTSSNFFLGTSNGRRHNITTGVGRGVGKPTCWWRRLSLLLIRQWMTGVGWLNAKHLSLCLLQWSSKNQRFSRFLFSLQRCDPSVYRHSVSWKEDGLAHQSSYKLEQQINFSEPTFFIKKTSFRFSFWQKGKPSTPNFFHFGLMSFWDWDIFWDQPIQQVLPWNRFRVTSDHSRLYQTSHRNAKSSSSSALKSGSDIISKIVMFRATTDEFRLVRWICMPSNLSFLATWQVLLRSRLPRKRT